MKRFVEGTNRSQVALFPACVGDWIGENNPVRVIDIFVDELDLGDLGFSGVDPKATGRPSYHPSVLLKLYIYGYLNQVQSSRRLEREAGRNVCTQFVDLCRGFGLLAEASVAIDGSKFKAVNNRDRNMTVAKMKRRKDQIDKSVARYLHQLDSADRQEPSPAVKARTTRLKEKIEKLKEEMERLDKLEAEMQATPEKQISLTHPDARSMATSGLGSGVVGYNGQTALDTKNHLIVTHEVTNTGNDRRQLSTMAKQTKAVLEVVADRGYFYGPEILACEQACITVTLPKPMTSGNRVKGMFVKPDFRYVAEDDVYICPADQRLTYRNTNQEKELRLRHYWTNQCQSCVLKDRCTTGKERRISRWKHEHVLETVQQRLDMHPEKMRQRRETVEHPFGTIQARMGATHFLMKTLKRVRTEMALHVLAYNLTRVINILGVGPLMKAIRT